MNGYFLKGDDIKKTEFTVYNSFSKRGYGGILKAECGETNEKLFNIFSYEFANNECSLCGESLATTP